MAAIDDLLARIADPALRADLERELAPLRNEREFGLIFERHLPETVRLIQHPVRRGVKVQQRADADGPVWTVIRVRAGTSIIERIDDTGARLEASVPSADLVVIREFGEAIYPGLRSLGALDAGGDKPFHVVLKGENYHALETLLYTHSDAVDVIYIDPPYNLGGDLTYNDHRVGREDSFRHSKWLSFMDRRLRMARGLLRQTGTIIVAIDDTEHAYLRVLMDQIFGEQNFIANVVWQGSVKNDARFTGGGIDYMLIYARNKGQLTELDIRWREPKEGLQDVLDEGARCWEKHRPDHLAATKSLSSWWNRNKHRYDPGLGDNVKIDTDGTVIKVGNLSWPGGGGPKYDVLHPVTGKPVKPPSRGWIYADPRKMQAEIAAGRVLFGEDHASGARRKTPLAQMETQVVKPSFAKERRASAGRLADLMGAKTFDFPKDPEVLARWISIVSGNKSDAVVLDFFAGSGSTAHAVMLLNERDGGWRQAILVTNNELSEAEAKTLKGRGLGPGDEEWEAAGVFQRSTKPRLEAVVTGRRPDGSEHRQGRKAENVVFLELTYLDRDRVQLGMTFRDVAPLLWLRAGARGPRIDAVADGWALPHEATYGVLFACDRWPEFAQAVASSPSVTHAFLMTDSDAVFQQVAGELPGDVQPVRLYGDYLDAFAINTGRQR